MTTRKAVLFFLLLTATKVLGSDDFQREKQLLAAAKAGDLQAQFALGELYVHSRQLALQNPRKAEEWLTAAAKRDHLPAIMSLLALYQKADLGADDELRLSWLSRAADLGEVTACYQLGQMYWEGPRGVKRDRSRGLELIRQAASRGEIEALVFLADESLKGIGLLRHEDNARSLLQLAAQRGSLTAAIYLKQFDPSWQRLPDLPLAVRSLEKAAKGGDAHSMLLLGRAYETGTGVTSSISGTESMVLGFAQARSWYEKSAVAGSAEAHARLGVLNTLGIDAPANLAAASKNFRAAADMNNALGQLNLAVLLLRRQAKDNDPEKPRRLLEQASRENPNAAFEYAMLFYEGNLVGKDVARAAEIFLSAAKAGNASALTNLGVIAINGELGQADLVSATQWWQLAADAGSRDAQSFLQRTAGRLTPEQRDAATRAVRTWRETRAAEFLAQLPPMDIRGERNAGAKDK